jgi:hypothetical protein
MLSPLAKVRFCWTLGPSDQLLGEHRHPADWKVARIQGPVSVRQQHALKNLRQLSPKTQAQLAPTLAFARHLAIGVARPHRRVAFPAVVQAGAIRFPVGSDLTTLNNRMPAPTTLVNVGQTVLLAYLHCGAGNCWELQHGCFLTLAKTGHQHELAIRKFE